MKIGSGKRILANFGLFYAAAIWGSTFFLVKGALDHIDPVILVAYRFLLAGIIMLIFLLLTGRNIFAHLKKGIILAVILFMLYIPQTIGLGITTASNSGFITGLFVVFVPIFMLTLFRKKPNILEIMAVAVSLIGLWILTGGMTEVNWGDILTLGAAMTYALHVLYSDKYIKQKIDPYVLSCQQFLIIGIMAIVCGLIFDLPFTVGTTFTWGVIIFLAIFPTMSAFVIQLIAQKITTPLKVSLIFALEPVFAGIFAWTLGGEEFVIHKAIGGGFIFAALVLSGLPSKKIKFRRI